MQNISVEELKSKMDAGENFRLVDVREPEENSEFNIGGILIPLKSVMGMQIDELENYKDDEIIVYCRSGNRSGQAAMFLETMGFKNVKNLAGGMLAWKERIASR